VLAVADPSRRRRWLGIALLGPVLIVVNFPFKLLFGRKRPSVPGHLRHLSEPTDSPSFPSAHAVSSFAVATTISRIEPRSRPYVLSAASLVAVSRPYLGVHHPTDVFGGALFGAGVGWLLTLKRVRHRWP
jgi:membrane-associated phospholipid phosphatase